MFWLLTLQLLLQLLPLQLLMFRLLILQLLSLLRLLMKYQHSIPFRRLRWYHLAANATTTAPAATTTAIDVLAVNFAATLIADAASVDDEHAQFNKRAEAYKEVITSEERYYESLWIL